MWALIAIVVYTGYGVTTVNEEFASQEQCIAASTALVQNVNKATYLEVRSSICVPKGYKR